MSTFERKDSGTYESDAYKILGLATTNNGRTGSRINKWLVIDKATDSIVSEHRTLARAKESVS